MIHSLSALAMRAFVPPACYGTKAMTASTSPDAILQQARDALRGGNYPAAITLYTQAIEQDDRNAVAHEGLATAAFLIQDYDRASTHYQRASMLDQRRAEPLINLGAVHNRRKDYMAAVKALRQALQKDRKSAPAYYNLGIAHRGLNQLSMAVSAYKESIRLDADSPEAYSNLGNVYVEMGNLQQAILNYRRALGIRSNFTRAQNGLDRALQIQEEQKKESSPFGRLVDADQAIRQQETSTAIETTSGQQLTAEERYSDRSSVHNLTAVFERLTADLLNAVRDELNPAILEVSRTFSHKGGQGSELVEATQKMQKALKTYQRATENVDMQQARIREHNNQITKLLSDR